jgi:hypothetical protein
MRLLIEMGYGVWGDIGAPASAMPRLSIRDRMDLAKLVMTEQERQQLDARGRTAEFIQKTNLAWAELARSWSYRIGAAEMQPYHALQALNPPMIATRPQMWASSFSLTPAGIGWIYHSLDVSTIDQQFLFEWQDTGQPAIVLNRRDPRDALISAVNFLSDGDRFRNIRKSPEAQLYAPSYVLLDRLEDRIKMALSDPCLPLFQDYDRAVTFYRHPAVCNVSFEELVGPQGGGTLAAQQDAVDRVAAFLGVACDPAKIADTLFHPESFTFHKGQIGVWRNVLSDEMQAAFNARHAGMATALGYR